MGGWIIFPIILEEIGTKLISNVYTTKRHYKRKKSGEDSLVRYTLIMKRT